MILPMSKADLIRQYLQIHPNLGPTELAKKLNEDHPDLKTPVRPQEVSNMSRRTGKPKTMAGPQEDIVEALECLKKAIGIFGKDQCKRLIDLF